MYTCPCCYATTSDGPPHGEGEPCPTAMTLRQAEITERKTHADLMEAQRDATRGTNPGARQR